MPRAEAEKPADWDEDEDGEWEPPKVRNPKCEEAGCGEWSPKKVPNPTYKGKWSAELIDNPEYKVLSPSGQYIAVLWIVAFAEVVKHVEPLLG